jgi:hypothetical protein
LRLDCDVEGHGRGGVADVGEGEGGGGAAAVRFGRRRGTGADGAAIRRARELVAVVPAVLVALQIPPPVRLQNPNLVVHRLVVVILQRIVDVPH